MENKFDKFVQQKLEQRTFEFNPDHWEGAADLLDAQDKKGGWWKRGIFLFGGVLLLACMLWGWGQFSGSTSSAEDTQRENDVQQSILSSTNTTASTKESKLETNLKTTETKAIKTPNNNTSTTGQVLAKSAKAITSKPEQKNTSITERNTTSIAVNNLQETKTQTNIQENKLSTISGSLLSSEASLETEKVVNRLEENVTSGNYLIEQEKGNVQVPAMETKTLPVFETTNKRSQQTEGKGQVLIGKEDVKGAAFTVVEQLPTLTGSALEASDQKENVDDLNLIKPLNKTGFKRVQVGLQISSLLYPAKADEKTMIGYAFGLSTQYRISRQFSINADLLYQKRTGTFTDTDMNSQTVYRFGYERMESVFKASSLHYLEVPVYLQLKHKAHVFDLGYAFNHLLGAKGTITERSSSSLNPEPIDGTSSSVWFTSNTFMPNFSTAFLGYRFQIGRQWQLGIRAHYNLSPLMTEDGELDQKLLEADKLHFRTLVRFSF